MLQASMTLAINELYDLKAIELVPLQSGDTLHKTIWVHQPKLDIDGKVIRTKSRACPQGFRFRPDIDYDPDRVASAAPHVQTLMLGFSMEVNLDMHTTHLDVTNCFQAYSELPPDSRILLAPPDGFYVPPGYAIRMINALQGSPQAGRLWQDKADKYLVETLHFNQSTIDPCYYWRWNGDIFTQIVRTVDDFRVSSVSKTICDEICSNLCNTWKMTVQVNKSWNGMSINHSLTYGTLTICMKRDIQAMLDEFGMSDCKPERIPADPKVKLVKPTIIDQVAAAFPYKEAVGQLLWFARTGRPDILYAVNQLSKFSYNWNSTHVNAVKKVMRYLKGTLDLNLTLRRSKSTELTVYADSDFAAEPEENDSPMCSTSGMVAYMHGIGALYSSVNLEKTISHSTAEAEYKSISRASKFVEGIRQFLEELGFPQLSPTVIYNDNQAAIAMSKQSFSSSSTRHMKIKFHYIRQLVKDGSVKVNFLPTTSMVADMMTKALDRVLFERFRKMLLDGIDDEGNLM